MWCIPSYGIEKGKVAEDGMPVLNEDETSMDPSSGEDNEPNGVDCNTDPGELKGLVNGAGLVCVLNEGKTEGSGRAGFGEVATMGNKVCCSWLDIIGTSTSVVGWPRGDRCNIGWIIPAVACCLASSLLFAL